MRSRTARLTIAALAWLTLGVTAFLFLQSTDQLTRRQDAASRFAARAADVSTALLNTRAAFHAYVADGQSAAFWAERAATEITDVTTGLDDLRPLATSGESRRSLMEAAALVADLGAIDRRAREYLTGGQPLMASDVIFSAGNSTIAEISDLIVDARSAEETGLVADTDRANRAQIYGGGIALGLLLLFVGLLAIGSTVTERPGRAGQAGGAGEVDDLRLTSAMFVDTSVAPPPIAAAEVSDAPRPSLDTALQDAARICAALSSVTSEEDLRDLLGRTATLVCGGAVAIWLDESHNGAFRPVVAHGYSDRALARMPAVPHDADNAVAHACRTSMLQIVAAASPGDRGALVAPLVVAGACIGAMTIELDEGRESLPGVQALVSLVASQLAAVVAPATSAERRAASA